MDWLPEPDEGSSICLGFDGSEVSDWTSIRAETRDGFSFTPRFNGGGTMWDPSKFPGHRVPRAEVDAAVDELFSRFEVRRFYCDPPGWRTEIESWSHRYGTERVIEWPTYRAMPMHAALERFMADLVAGRINHDGCPDTALHLGNARVSKRRDGRYLLEKPDADRKIDAAMTTVLAHEAAADERAAGWADLAGPTYFRLPR